MSYIDTPFQAAGAGQLVISLLGKRTREARRLNQEQVVMLQNIAAVDASQTVLLQSLEVARATALDTNNQQQLSISALMGATLDLIPNAAGDLDVANNRIINVSDPIDAQDVMTKQYFLDHTTLNSVALNQIPAPLGSVSLANQNITNLKEPTLAKDAATKQYVDTNAVHGTTKVVVEGTAVAATVDIGFIPVVPATDPVTYVPVRISGVAKPLQGTDAVSLFYLLNDYDIPLKQYARDQDALAKTFATDQDTLVRTFVTTQDTLEREFATGDGRTVTLTQATTNAKALRLDEFQSAQNAVRLGTVELPVALMHVKNGIAAQDAATITNLLTYITTYAWTRSGQILFGAVPLVGAGTTSSITTSGYLSSCEHIGSTSTTSNFPAQVLSVKTYQLNFADPGFDVALNFNWSMGTAAGYAGTLYGLGHGIPAIVHSPDPITSAGLVSYYVTAQGVTNYKSKIVIVCSHIAGTFTTQTLNIQFIRASQA